MERSTTMGANTSDPRPGPSDQVRPDGATGPDGITEPDEATKPDDATSTRDAAEPDAAISAGDAAAAAVPASTLIVMGVSGSGKTTVASLLADRLGRRLLEGDEMHSAEAIEKMASGQPLDDEDRWPWLRRIRAWIETQAEAEQSGIIACSALKHSYRDLLADGGGVVFVYLHVGRAELHRRLAQRTGHYMKAEMLDSQLDTLEPPTSDEPAVTIDAHRSSEEIVADVLRHVSSVS